ncbi:MAG: acetyl-CoA carboxylase carboxyltransferase subunit alpha [Puniceicoccales bacterium]|jgi:acetyl-CoA carboxylase carboxyl transferase subunit alpha|nr:acetyl-CoA carboxylase carboxyltransferase subunit alpha [Puniceicoccales bacterium]
MESHLPFERPLVTLEKQLEDLRQQSQESHIDFCEEIAAIERKIEAVRRDAYEQLGIWERIQLARHPRRPYALDYIERLFCNFEEIHGDRLFGDDGAMVCGPAMFLGAPMMVIGQQKGRDVKENIRRNFGCPHPEGYRKALRAMKLAEKFSMPILCLIDTSGAYPGVGSEERHVGEAIAVNIREMSMLRVPIIGVVIGEGGSGGALGIGVVDRLLIFENAYYSVISPEGCAAILWKDRAKAPEAAKALRLSPQQLIDFSIADEVLPEPTGGAHLDYDAAANTLKKTISKHLNELLPFVPQDLIDSRHARYRKIGQINLLI